MKNTKKTVSVILTASMLMSLCACQDKSADEVLDLAEDVANYTCDMDYKKLSKLTEDGDEKLEERFESIEEDDFKKAIAATLEFEFDEDSLEKNGKKGYTVEVTFTYVDYEEVMDESGITSLSDWEDALDDCDELVEETITLEFEKDGSDILFVNIDDLEDLFKYYDEDIAGAVIEDVEDEPVATTITEPSEADPTPTPAPSATPTPAPTSSSWDNADYPDPADYFVQDQCYLLPETNILFTAPATLSTISGPETGDDFFMLTALWDYSMNEAFSIMEGAHVSCTGDSALQFRDSMADTYASTVTGYQSHTMEYINLEIAGDTYECALATITTESGETFYVLVAMIGNDDCYYMLLATSSNMDNINELPNYFSRVG